MERLQELIAANAAHNPAVHVQITGTKHGRSDYDYERRGQGVICIMNKGITIEPENTISMGLETLVYGGFNKSGAMSAVRALAEAFEEGYPGFTRDLLEQMLTEYLGQEVADDE